MAEISRAELKYLVERQREEIRTLNEVGRLLSAATHPQEILRLVTTYLHHAFPVALSSVFVFEERVLHLMPLAPLGQMELTRAIRRVREAASELLHRPLSEQDSAPLIETLDGRAIVGMPSTIALRSEFFAPLTVKDQPIGLLSVFSGQDDGFTKEDEHAVGIVAEQLGAALRNAVLVEELRRAGTLKTELLSIMSHELSTPLTAIREGVSLVLEGEAGATTAEQQRLLKVASDNADRLERLLQKVKWATELTTGQMTLSLGLADAQPLLSDVEQTHRAAAKAMGVELTLIAAAVPLTCPIDRAHLMIALDQVVENALQATPEGGIVSVQGSMTPLGVEIQIVDTGIGIAPEALPKLFEQFKSVGSIDDRKMGGLGLGLFIAKSLIEGHGGRMTVESTPGKGTRMTVHLPNPSS